MKSNRASYEALYSKLRAHDQSQLLRFWDKLAEDERARLARSIEALDLPLLERLLDNWIRGKPEPERFDQIEPVAVVDADDASRGQAIETGEETLRAGRVGLVLVAGGQGTRLGFDGPKGAFPIGPVSKRSLFAFHAEKIVNLQRRYGCVLPWYIMVGESNATATRAFFERERHFGLDPANVRFFQQRVMPCVDDAGKILLEEPAKVSTNPNGHGGCIPALVESGILDDARARGIDTLSYFQVDNWAVKVADPVFIGYHVLRGSEFSAKVHRRKQANESAGVFCTCDGRVHVIEYTEFDLFPEIHASDRAGAPVHFAANAAIHVLSVDFVERVARNFHGFPWHCSHKAVPHIDEAGKQITPKSPNAYKFETFIFDALKYCERAPVVLEIGRAGEFTPTKQMEGPGSVQAARADMARFWGDWLTAAGCPGGRERAAEISPQFALTCDEFVEKTQRYTWPERGLIAIGPEGEFIT